MKTKIILFALFAACGGFCLTSCGGGDDNVSGEVNRSARPVNTGVYLNNGKEIVVWDRNVGATKVGGIGTFLSPAVALNICSSGYHLMTYSEFRRFEAAFDTPEKFRDGVLKMPLAGLSSGAYVGVTGRYWIDRPDVPTQYQFASISLDPSETQPVYIGAIALSTSTHYQVRCVKDYD